MRGNDHPSHAGLILLSSVAALSAAEPIDIGSHRQLFLDDFIMERMDGVTRTASARRPRRQSSHHA